MKKRNSSMELLRIISMLAIIMSHYSTHGGWVSGIDNMGSFSMFGLENFSPNVALIQILAVGGQ